MSPCGLGGGQTSTGGPLTEFRRGRRSLPLPLERVKIGSRHVGPWWVLGRALTDFRRRRRNLPLPQARGGLAGCGSTRAHSTGSGQALRRTPARLTMNGGYEYLGSGWWEVGVTLVRWDCWVLLGPGRGRRDDGGTEVGRRGECGLGCVQSVGAMCSVFGRMCSVSGPMCSLFS